MTTQATTMRQEKQGKGGKVALVGATALTLVALGGAALWGLRPGGESAAPGMVSTTAGVGEGVLPKGGLAEQEDEQRGGHAVLRTDTSETLDGAGAAVARGGLAERSGERTPTTVPTVYIVESEERARAVRAGIEQLNASRATQGLAPLTAEAVSFVSAEAEVQFLQALNWVRGVPLASSLSVVDLRPSAAPAAAVPTLGVPALTDGAGHYRTERQLAAAPAPVVYLVATPEAAAFALRFGAEINELRAQLGQPQAVVGALVVGPDATPALDALPAAPGTRYHDLRESAGRTGSAPAPAVTTRGGMAESDAERDDVTQRAVVAAAEARVAERGGIAEMPSDQEMWTRLVGPTASPTVPERGGLAELYAEQATARTAAPTIAIPAGEPAAGLVGITDGRLVAVAVPTTPAAEAAARRAADGPCSDGGAAPVLVRLICA